MRPNPVKRVWVLNRRWRRSREVTKAHEIRVIAVIGESASDARIGRFARFVTPQDALRVASAAMRDSDVRSRLSHGRLASSRSTRAIGRRTSATRRRSRGREFDASCRLRSDRGSRMQGQQRAQESRCLGRGSRRGDGAPAGAPAARASATRDFGQRGPPKVALTLIATRARATRARRADAGEDCEEQVTERRGGLVPGFIQSASGRGIDTRSVCGAVARCGSQSSYEARRIRGVPGLAPQASRHVFRAKD